MASKYAGLKGKIPVELTPRQENVQREYAERKDRTFAQLAEEYNKLDADRAELARKAAGIKAKADAIEDLMREALDGMDADKIVTQGYNWSDCPEPYPVVEDIDAIVKYFNEHEMGDQLTLKKTELATRLRSFVKEEALANELIVTTVEDPVTHETRTEVRSNIPGVKVFLKPSLSRTKAAQRS